MTSDQRTPLGFLLAHVPVTRRTRILDACTNPNRSDPAYAALLQQGACDVVGFKPQPLAFADLAARKSVRETYFPFAVRNGSRKERKVGHSHRFTSVYGPHEQGQRVVAGRKWSDVLERIEFDTVSLDPSPEIGVFDLLKIDIQGGKYDVFRGAESSLRLAVAVIVKLRCFQLDAGEPMLGGVDTELRRQGFAQLRDQMNGGHAVYLRDLRRIDSCSEEQLAHLSILAASVFSSHTLVLHCLDELARRGAVSRRLAKMYVDLLPAELRLEGAAAE